MMHGHRRRDYRDHYSGKRYEKHYKKQKSAEASLTSGIVFTLVFGVVWFTTKQWFWVFPLAFAGLMPAAEGLRKLLSGRKRTANSAGDDNAEAEKEILRIAQREKGRITPALVALNSFLSIERAESILENLAKKGYASMHVTEDGRIEYEFPEFLPPA